MDGIRGKIEQKIEVKSARKDYLNVYFNDLMIFDAKASISNARRAVKGRAKFKSSTMIVFFIAGASTSFSSSFPFDSLSSLPSFALTENVEMM